MFTVLIPGITNIILYVLLASFLGAATSVIGIKNPIHSILLLIGVFILGSVTLFYLNMEYFGLLFLIVYVGAIVVLFLFIVMMLDLKLTNETDRFRDIFSYRHFILALLFFQIFWILSGEQNSPVFWYQETPKDFLVYAESNGFFDFSKILMQTSQLKALGYTIFTTYKLSVLLIGFLLFVAMVGAILLAFPKKEANKAKTKSLLSSPMD